MNSKSTLSARPFSLYRLPQARYDIASEITRGLRASQKTIEPKFFYDERGSQLFEKITKTFDYYVTRAETEILHRYGPAIAATVGTDAVLIEPGCGNCRKVEYLLEALRPSLYVPIDISATALEAACWRLSSRYEWLPCQGVAADFFQFDKIAELLPEQRRVIFFPGSTIGNSAPHEAVCWLRNMRKLIQPQGGLLIGVDNVKERDILERAYNDRADVTAAFNKNILDHINRIAPADFEPDTFDHRAVWNQKQSRIEMHLVSRIDQVVNVAGKMFNFKTGETIHTENSYKYSRSAFRALAAEAGLQCVQSWHDQRDYFTLYYLVCDPQTLVNEYEPSEFLRLSV